MTKQQIVVQFCAAKIAGSGFFPGIDDLKNYGGLADKIIEMFPEPEYTVAGSPLTVSVAGWEAGFDKYMESFTEDRNGNQPPPGVDKEAEKCPECGDWIVGGCQPGMSCY